VIDERITQLRQTLPPHVRLIAVTKYVSVAAMRQAYAAGIRDFGENRVQDAIAKQDQLKDLQDVTWHLIGHLQTNKVKLALQRFDWIHTLDSLDLAQRLDRYAATLPPAPSERNVLLQVKILPDPNKFGWSVPELWQALPQLDQCQNLRICGLMAILPQGLSSDEQLNAFQNVKLLADEIKTHPWKRIQMQQLSMGMSGDYQLAVQAGATMVRLGTYLFEGC
jgi:PLP dependent protein